MKEMMKMLLVAVCGATAAWGHAALPAVRVDTRAVPLIATGVEYVGSADGTVVAEWDTTQVEDGWWRVANDGALGITRPTGEASHSTVDVLVLNGPSVVGGRMSQSAAWDDERVVVVRHDVVVPSGTTLMLGAGCIVKFTEGARIVVEDGGSVVAEGAYLAAFDDDSVGGDTDMNGALRTTRPTKGGGNRRRRIGRHVTRRLLGEDEAKIIDAQFLRPARKGAVPHATDLDFRKSCHVRILNHYHPIGFSRNTTIP